jgi:hypothetical protein
MANWETPQREDQLIHLIKDRLHLAWVVAWVQVDAHLAHGIAVVAGLGQGVVQLDLADFPRRSRRTITAGGAGGSHRAVVALRDGKAEAHVAAAQAQADRQV